MDGVLTRALARLSRDLIPDKCVHLHKLVLENRRLAFLTPGHNFISPGEEIRMELITKAFSSKIFVSTPTAGRISRSVVLSCGQLLTTDKDMAIPTRPHDDLERILLKSRFRTQHRRCLCDLKSELVLPPQPLGRRWCLTQHLLVPGMNFGDPLKMTVPSLIRQKDTWEVAWASFPKGGAVTHCIFYLQPSNSSFK